MKKRSMWTVNPSTVPLIRKLAEQFFDAFSPETLIEAHAARYADLVIVLRTDDGQMQEFGELLAAHGSAAS